jgi:flagellar motility protein MotE (MotC chaperone)
MPAVYEQLQSNRVSPVREKMADLEAEKGELSRERGEAEAKTRAELDHLRVTYEDMKKTSDTINK